MYKTVIHTSALDNEVRGGEVKEKLKSLCTGELEVRENFTVYHHKQAVSKSSFDELSHLLKIDINTLPLNFIPGEVKLLVTDMDSTLISIECVDEIADYAGLKTKVKKITDAAMCGELDFVAALTQRVQLLTGLDQSILQAVYDSRLKLNPGAEMMLSCLKSKRIKIALVSGGFTFFTDKLKSRLQLDYTKANELTIENGLLSGKLSGEIVGAEAKRDYLLALSDELGVLPENTLAIGDGANDLKMLDVAGLSIAYHAKEKVQQAADISFNYCGLDGVCDLLSIE